MKIASVHIENFRSFADATISLNDYGCLVGPNGAGKSTGPTALNVFFRESENIPTELSQLDQEDFHRRNTDIPIRITIAFTDLGDKAQNDLADYVRQGQLVISAEATFNGISRKADVKQYGQRLGMPDFAPFFKGLRDGMKVAERKEIYCELRNVHPDLPPHGTKDAMTRTLRRYEAERPEKCGLIPSEDQFYAFSKGTNRLSCRRLRRAG